MKLDGDFSVDNCNSFYGSGAGRPSGGPCFNAVLDSAFHEAEIEFSDI